MPALYKYRIFISHAWKYGDNYNRLVKLLDNAPNFSYINYSAPKEKPLFEEGTPLTSKKIADAITNKIKNTQVTLVISGMYVNYKDWIKYEIDESKRLGKPIIAISPWGAQRMPTYVSENATTIVGWNTSSIVSAIRDLVK